MTADELDAEDADVPLMAVEGLNAARPLSAPWHRDDRSSSLKMTSLCELIRRAEQCSRRFLRLSR